MGVPFIQKYRIAQYVFSQRLRGKRRYPLFLMLEPFFRCNLACAGCGKIRYPEEVLERRLSTGECLAAADECGAPVISAQGRARFSERAGDRRPFSPRSGREPDRSRLRILRGHANTRHPIA